MTKKGETQPQLVRKLCLIFTKHDDREYELYSMRLDDNTASASRRRDKRQGDSFQWKSGSGIVALSLFFVEAWTRLQSREDSTITLKRPRLLSAVPIWSGALNENKEIDIEHPLGKIRTNLVRNRIRSSLYLYRLFYSDELDASGGSFLELGVRETPTGPTLLNRIEANDRIEGSYRSEFDELIYLGCLLVKRDTTSTENGQFASYFCWDEKRKIEIEIKTVDNPAEQAPRPVTPSEGSQILRSLRERFPSALQHQETQKKATAPISNTSYPRRNSRVVQVCFSMILVLMGLLIGRFWPQSHEEAPQVANPSVVSIENKQVSVFDTKGNLIWTKQMEGWVLNDEAFATDLDSDGLNEIIVPVAGIDTATGGKLYAYSATGKLLWHFALTDRPPFKKPASGKFAIREVLIDKLYSQEKSQIILLMYDAHGWGCSSLSVVNWDGISMWNYWHPGHLTHVLIGSKNSNTRKRLVVGGINNSFASQIPGPFSSGPKSNYPRSVFVLNPFRSETAPSGYGYDPRPSPLLEWYGIISPEPIGIERLDIIDDDYDGEFHITIWANAGRGWNFDFSGELINEIRTAGPYLKAELHQIHPKNDLELQLSHSVSPNTIPKAN